MENVAFIYIFWIIFCFWIWIDHVAECHCPHLQESKFTLWSLKIFPALTVYESNTQDPQNPLGEDRRWTEIFRVLVRMTKPGIHWEVRHSWEIRRGRSTPVWGNRRSVGRDDATFNLFFFYFLIFLIREAIFARYRKFRNHRRLKARKNIYSTYPSCQPASQPANTHSFSKYSPSSYFVLAPGIQKWTVYMSSALEAIPVGWWGQ